MPAALRRSYCITASLSIFLACSDSAEPVHGRGQQPGSANSSRPDRIDASATTRDVESGSAPAGAGESAAGATAADAPGDAGAREPATVIDSAPSDSESPQREAPPPIAAKAAATVEVWGPLIGPALSAGQPPAYGSRLGVTFEHRNELVMLLGDAWAQADAVCPADARPNDDLLAGLTRGLSSELPVLVPRAAQPVRLFRDGTEIGLGYGLSPIAGFSDGAQAFAVFGAGGQLELGLARGDDLATYDSVVRLPAGKFSQPALRTVAKFSGQSSGSDFSSGSDAVLVWGRPALVAEHGRQAPLYFMWHRLPLARDATGQIAFEPQYFAGVDASGEPRWSRAEADARPIALDGRESGDPYEQLQITGRMSLAWVPAPVAQWVMLYGGDLSESSLLDPASARGAHAPGAIRLRFADRPWGPFTPPLPHVDPRSLAGPSGILFSPECRDTNDARCAPANPPAAARCSPPLPARGQLSAPNIIDGYTAPNEEGGVDLVWSVSTGNPYGIQLLRTTFTPQRAPSDERELADDRGLERLRQWSTLPELGDTSRYRQQSSYDRGTEGDIWALSRAGNRDYNNFVCASADANIRPQLSPFRYDRPTCEESYVRGAVMARFVGAGRHVRSWIAMSSLRERSGQVLRLYVDDDPVPRVEAPLADVLDGRAGEIFAPPFGAGSNERSSWYYPVAFKTKFIAALDELVDDDHYFHWDVMLDGTPTASASSAPYPTRREAAAAQLGAVYHPVGTLEPIVDARELTLAAHEVRRLELQGPATIGELRVRLPESDYARLASVRARIRWDAALDPAIDVSLLELLGNGRVPPERSTQALTSFLEESTRTLALKLPMPFERAAEIELENASESELAFELALFGRREVPSRGFGRLHVQRRETVGPTQLPQHLAVEASGTGRLVGLCYFLQGTPDTGAGIAAQPLNALEGDVRARIDGESALEGTGSEEYADDIYYFRESPLATPFVQTWGVQTEPSPGLANACRWHVFGTELDFASSLQLTFDLGGSQNPEVVDRLRTVAYLYQ